MNFYVPILTILFAVNTATAQTKLFTKTGTISFSSKTPLENIAAVNNKVLSVWETATLRRR